MRKHKFNVPRSDSIGSVSGRKNFLVPTLSDPAARVEKERLSTKKKNKLPTGSEQINRIQREVFNNKTSLPKISNASNEIRDWWCEQLNYASQSSDEDCF